MRVRSHVGDHSDCGIGFLPLKNWMAVSNDPCVEIWAGSSLGILKGKSDHTSSSFLIRFILTAITLSNGKFMNYLPTGMTVKDTTRCMEILDMCWDHDSEEKV